MHLLDLIQEYNERCGEVRFARMYGTDTIMRINHEQEVVYSSNATELLRILVNDIDNYQEYRKHLMNRMDIADIRKVLNSNDEMDDCIFCHLVIRNVIEEYFEEEID